MFGHLAKVQSAIDTLASWITVTGAMNETWATIVATWIILPAAAILTILLLMKAVNYSYKEIGEWWANRGTVPMSKKMILGMVRNTLGAAEKHLLNRGGEIVSSVSPTHIAPSPTRIDRRRINGTGMEIWAGIDDRTLNFIVSARSSKTRFQSDLMTTSYSLKHVLQENRVAERELFCEALADHIVSSEKPRCLPNEVEEQKKGFDEINREQKHHDTEVQHGGGQQSSVQSKQIKPATTLPREDTHMDDPNFTIKPEEAAKLLWLLAQSGRAVAFEDGTELITDYNRFRHHSPDRCSYTVRTPGENPSPQYPAGENGEPGHRAIRAVAKAITKGATEKTGEAKPQPPDQKSNDTD